MTTTTEAIDTAALRDYLGPRGKWATAAGDKVRQRRMQAGLTTTQLAASVGVSAQTVAQIEAGQLVPRDYLRAAIAHVLRQDIEFFWPPLTWTRIDEIGTVL